MKKLTLTFCALFALLVVAPALYADGPEKYSGKEKEVMQPAPPVCELYRAHEWDLDIWGSFMFSANPGTNFGRLDLGPAKSGKDDPFFPDRDPYIHTVVTGPGGSNTFQEPQGQNPNERVDLGLQTKDRLMGRDNTFGGGVDLKYFWSRYFGFGFEGLGIGSKTNFAGAELGTLTARFPFGRFAPYGWAGIGFLEGGAGLDRFFNEKHQYAGGFVVGALPPDQGDARNNPHEHEFWTDDPIYNHNVRGIGQLGVGLEFRLTCHIGLMTDFSWNFVFGKSSDDRETVIREFGENVTTIVNTATGITTTNSVPVMNSAIKFTPGTDSDHQDFGMARFGVTFSY